MFHIHDLRNYLGHSYQIVILILTKYNICMNVCVCVDACGCLYLRMCLMYILIELFIAQYIFYECVLLLCIMCNDHRALYKVNHFQSMYNFTSLNNKYISYWLLNYSMYSIQLSFVNFLLIRNIMQYLITSKY